MNNFIDTCKKCHKQFYVNKLLSCLRTGMGYMTGVLQWKDTRSLRRTGWENEDVGEPGVTGR